MGKLERQSIYVNPQELEKMVSRDFRDLNQSERIKFKTGFKQLAPYFDQLPRAEADAIVLYYLHRKSQVDIAQMLGVTQPRIHFMIKRGLQRMRFLLEYPIVNTRTMKKDLIKVFNRPPIWDYEQGAEIAIRMYKTSCQRVVAKQLGTTQSRVRDRFYIGLKRLSRVLAEQAVYQIYYKALTMIRDNPNILRKVVQPRWEARYKPTTHISQVRVNVILGTAAYPQ